MLFGTLARRNFELGIDLRVVGPEATAATCIAIALIVRIVFSIISIYIIVNYLCIFRAFRKACASGRDLGLAGGRGAAFLKNKPYIP